MTDQLVGVLLGAARMGLVVAALLVALLPIGRSAVEGFCAEGADAGDARGRVVLAAPADVALGPLATIVEPTPTDPATPATPPATPSDGATTPVEGAADPCEPGVERCLPPLISAVLVFGESPCSDEAVSILRSRMLPAFLVASALLAGAWVLRPRDGVAVADRR